MTRRRGGAAAAARPVPRGAGEDAHPRDSRGTKLLDYEWSAAWLLARAAPQEYDPKAARAVLTEVGATLRERPAPAVLLDVRAIRGNPSMTERFLLVAHAALLRLPVPMAMVASEPLLHPGRIGQILARARGLDVRVFMTIEEAGEWLRHRVRPAGA